MLVDHRLKPVSYRYYLWLFSDWDTRSIAKIQRQLHKPDVVGGICFEVVNRRSVWQGARAHLPVGPEQTLREFSDVFLDDQDEHGRPLKHPQLDCHKYPRYSYRRACTAEERYWESRFDKHWQRYLVLEGAERCNLANVLISTELDMTRYHNKQRAQVETAASCARSCVVG